MIFQTIAYSLEILAYLRIVKSFLFRAIRSFDMLALINLSKTFFTLMFKKIDKFSGISNFIKTHLQQ